LIRQWLKKTKRPFIKLVEMSLLSFSARVLLMVETGRKREFVEIGTPFDKLRDRIL
tara:strand:+ start:1187 stop:1354 length:168 start_codon:yes stop_codon:yes gene_type:complete